MYIYIYCETVRCNSIRLKYRFQNTHVLFLPPIRMYTMYYYYIEYIILLTLICVYCTYIFIVYIYTYLLIDCICICMYICHTNAHTGHGGSEAATFAKENLINLIVNQKLFWSNDDQDVLRAIEEGYIATHYAMWREQGT